MYLFKKPLHHATRHGTIGLLALALLACGGGDDPNVFDDSAYTYEVYVSNCHVDTGDTGTLSDIITKLTQEFSKASSIAQKFITEETTPTGAINSIKTVSLGYLTDSSNNKTLGLIKIDHVHYAEYDTACRNVPVGSHNYGPVAATFLDYGDSLVGDVSFLSERIQIAPEGIVTPSNNRFVRVLSDNGATQTWVLVRFEKGDAQKMYIDTDPALATPTVDNSEINPAVVYTRQ